MGSVIIQPIYEEREKLDHHPIIQPVYVEYFWGNALKEERDQIKIHLDTQHSLNALQQDKHLTSIKQQNTHRLTTLRNKIHIIH